MTACKALGVGLVPPMTLLAVVFSCAELRDEPRIHLEDQVASFYLGDTLVTRYHTAAHLAKPHFHPVLGPGDVPVTRGYPMVQAQGESRDHPHQRALWFTHGDVIPEGITLSRRAKGVQGIDFWSEQPGHGRIVCVGWEPPRLVHGTVWLVTRNEWRTAEGQRVLDEVRRIGLADLSPARLLIVEIELVASVCPIVFGDTKEGAFGIRVHDAMTERKGGVIENALGAKTERDCWGRQADWCDYSGIVQGKHVGVALFDDRANAYRSCWHARAYGLMAANPFGRGKSGFPAVKGRTDLVRLARGERLQLRYGVLVHPGDARQGRVQEHYETFLRLRS
ncbi:MAG: hypothetical protein C4297_12815 [Gemmataceae bacterium]